MHRAHYFSMLYGRRKLQKLYENTHGHYRRSGVYYCWRRKRLIKYWVYPHDRAELKRKCNKKIRSCKNGIPDGSTYRKMTEYDWELY